MARKDKYVGAGGSGYGSARKPTRRTKPTKRKKGGMGSMDDLSNIVSAGYSEPERQVPETQSRGKDIDIKARKAERKAKAKADKKAEKAAKKAEKEARKQAKKESANNGPKNRTKASMKNEEFFIPSGTPKTHVSNEGFPPLVPVEPQGDVGNKWNVAPEEKEEELPYKVTSPYYSSSGLDSMKTVDFNGVPVPEGSSKANAGAATDSSGSVMPDGEVSIFDSTAQSGAGGAESSSISDLSSAGYAAAVAASGFNAVAGGASADKSADKDSTKRADGIEAIGAETEFADKKRPKTHKEDLTGTEKRKKRKRNKKIRKIVIIVSAIVLSLLLAGGIYLYSSDYFKIEKIEINGVEHLTENEMLELAAVPEDTTLLRVDTEIIKKRLLKDAWIKEVDIDRKFPNTLVINVTERPITAIVEVPTSSDSGVSTSSSTSTKSKDTTVRNWAISSDFMWLMPIPDQNSEAGKKINQQIYNDVAGVMHVVDVSPSVQPEIGSYCTDENVNCAINVVASMTTDLKNQVKNVKAADPYSTTLVLQNGVEIAIGTSEDIREKERVCLELLKKYEGKIAYINVRNVTNPTWRMVA